MFSRNREFTVRGSGLFPTDMLRYDACWPKSGSDVRKIDSSIARTNFAGQVVEVTLVGRTAPTHRRWESFGWKVLP